MAISKLILNGEVQMDVTSDTVEANKLLSGETATKNDGTKVTGTYIPPDPVISSLAVTPTESQQTFNAAGVSGYKPVTVGAIASDYVGSAIPMRSNADMYKSGYAVYAPAGYYSSNAFKPLSTYEHLVPTVSLNSGFGTVVARHDQRSAIMNQGVVTGDYETNVTMQLPTLSAQTYTPGSTTQIISSYQWLTGPQTIAAISSTYIGSAIPLRTNLSLSSWHEPAPNTNYEYLYFEGNAPYGYYSQITTSTTFMTISAYEANTIVPSTESRLLLMSSKFAYARGSVYLDAIPSSYIIPSGTYSVTENGTYDIGSYASVDVSVAGGGGDENAFIMRNFSSTVYENSTLTKIGSGAFAYVSTLSAVSVPNVTEIGDFAFLYTRLNFSSYSSSFNFSAVTSIGTGAFLYGAKTNTSNYWGGYISSSMFPEVTTIGSFAFGETCASGTFLKATSVGEGAFMRAGGVVTLPLISEIPKWCFVDASIITISSTDYPNVVTIGSAAFAHMDYSYVLRSTGVYTTFGGFNRNTLLSNVTFLNVKTIGDQAFYSAGLNYISFPKCETIGKYAFYSCHSLRSAIFPECTVVNASAFYNCYLLSIVSFPKCVSIGSYAFYLTSISTASFPECTTIADYAFQSCKSLTNADFPKCETIGSSAFASCTSLTTISFPECINIERSAFFACWELSIASFPECKTISFNAFYNCSKITEANFPKCSEIYTSAFLHCFSLSVANFPMCETVGIACFSDCSTLNNINFPECVSMSTGAFYRCLNLTNANFPKCEIISTSAFAFCSSLTTISFPECISIASGAFASCSSLMTVFFPKCTSIYSSAFTRCYTLSVVELPKLEQLEQYAFEYCSNLFSVNLTGVTSIPYMNGDNAFMATPIRSSVSGVYGSIYVPASLYNDFIVAQNWSTFSSRMVSV